MPLQEKNSQMVSFETAHLQTTNTSLSASPFPIASIKVHPYPIVWSRNKKSSRKCPQYTINCWQLSTGIRSCNFPLGERIHSPGTLFTSLQLSERVVFATNIHSPPTQPDSTSSWRSSRRFYRVQIHLRVIYWVFSDRLHTTTQDCDVWNSEEMGNVLSAAEVCTVPFTRHAYGLSLGSAKFVV